MRLYPKKLRNIEDLEREKKILLRKSKQLDKEDLLSLEGLLGKGKKKGKDKEEEDSAGSIVDLLPISNPMLKMGLKILETRILSPRKNKTKENGEPPATKNHPIRKVAIEIIGGYLKWKAIELSYKGIKYLIKKRKEKKEAGMQ